MSVFAHSTYGGTLLAAMETHERIGLLSSNDVQIPVDLHASVYPKWKNLLFYALLVLIPTILLVVSTLELKTQGDVLHGMHNTQLTEVENTKYVLITGFEPFGNYSTNPSEFISKLMNHSCIVPQNMNRICFETKVLPVSTFGASIIAEMLGDSENSMQINAKATQSDANFGAKREGEYVLESRFSAVLHLGLDASARRVLIETVAANVRAVEKGNGIVTELAAGSDVSCMIGSSSESPQADRFRNESVREILQKHYKQIDPKGDCILPSSANLGALDLNSLQMEAKNYLNDFTELISSQSTRFQRLMDPDPITVGWSSDLGIFFCNEIYYRTLLKIRSLALHQAHSNQLLPAVFVHLPTTDHLPLSVQASLIQALAVQLAQ